MRRALLFLHGIVAGVMACRGCLRGQQGRIGTTEGRRSFGGGVGSGVELHTDAHRGGATFVPASILGPLLSSCSFRTFVCPTQSRICAYPLFSARFKPFLRQ